MTIKSTILASLFAIGVSAPLALATQASAAPDRGNNMMMGGRHTDIYHDHGHRPPPQAEHRSHQPKGHFRWRAGAWSWSRDHWAWAPGIWIRF